LPASHSQFAIDGVPPPFYIHSQIRKIDRMPIVESAFLASTGENSGRGEGGVVLTKTSPSLAATTSGDLPSKRRRGAQPGNQQALKLGRYTAEKRELRRQIHLFIRGALDIAERVDVAHGGKPRRRRKK
jgi:hypothetical protein